MASDGLYLAASCWSQSRQKLSALATSEGVVFESATWAWPRTPVERQTKRIAATFIAAPTPLLSSSPPEAAVHAFVTDLFLTISIIDFSFAVGFV